MPDVSSSESDDSSSDQYSHLSSDDMFSEESDGMSAISAEDSDTDSGLLAGDHVDQLQGERECDVEEPGREVSTFKLCGDNVDKTVKRRYMRADKGNLSLHYFHSYAVLDRINVSGLSNKALPGCLPEPKEIAASLLPSSSDDSTLKRNFATLVSRVLATHFKFFKFSTLNTSSLLKCPRSLLL